MTMIAENSRIRVDNPTKLVNHGLFETSNYLNAVVRTILFGVSYGVGYNIASYFSAYLLNQIRQIQMDFKKNSTEEEVELSNIITQTQYLPYSFLRVPGRLISMLGNVPTCLKKSNTRIVELFSPLNPFQNISPLISSSKGRFRFAHCCWCILPSNLGLVLGKKDKNDNKDTSSNKIKPELSSDSVSEPPASMPFVLPMKPFSMSSSKNMGEQKSNEASTPTYVINRQKVEEKRSRSNSVLTQTDESIDNSASKKPIVKETRYFEMLVHNVSHMDMVLSLKMCSSLKEKENVEQLETSRLEHNSKHDLHNNKQSEEILCRPVFSTFHTFATRILLELKKCCNKHNIRSLSSDIASYPRYERSDCLPKFPLVRPPLSKQKMLPVGFKLSHIFAKNSCFLDGDGNCNMNSGDRLSLNTEDIQSLRIRGKDANKFESLLKTIGATDGIRTRTTDKTNFQLDSVLFPLLSSLLRKWHSQLLDKYGSTSRKSLKKVIVLVSGVGTPRNFSHLKIGNSTKACAELMEIFIKILYPDVAVIRLHSEREIFQYEENIHFSKMEFMPCIDAYRDAHARGDKYPDECVENRTGGDCDGSFQNYASTNSFDPDWKQTFAVTLSFADGAPARTHAIQTSLRPYKPCTMHFYELKTFWEETKICDDDVVHLSFEDMETVPAMEVEKTSPSVQMVVKEMKIFRQHFLKALNDENDLNNFWLRKTKKPVLSVLLVDLPEGGLVVYRGMNMEVSMPTGSLCAERNVIGTALASNPGLLREHLKMVAVLAVPIQNDEVYTSSHMLLPSLAPGIGPCLCEPISGKEVRTNEDTDCFFSSEVELKLSQYQQSEDLTMGLEPFGKNKLSKVTRSLSSPDLRIIPSSVGNKMPCDRISTTPIRKIKLHNYGAIDDTKATSSETNKFHGKKKRTVLVQEKDINPLKPCGACNEWLKKIAESNPYFKVITFTDTYCNGVYVMPCQG